MSKLKKICPAMQVNMPWLDHAGMMLVLPAAVASVDS